MGRNVTLDFSAGGGSDTEFLIGTITLEPTAVHEIGNRVVLPAPRATGINAGVGVLEDVAISPAGPEPAWAYRATVRDSISGKAQSWLVGVPSGTTAIPFKQLTKFTTTIPPQTTAGMMQNWANTTEANADRSELAADRAEAPTDLMNKTLIENSASLTAGALSAAIVERQTRVTVGVTGEYPTINAALNEFPNGGVHLDLFPGNHLATTITPNAALKNVTVSGQGRNNTHVDVAGPLLNSINGQDCWQFMRFHLRNTVPTNTHDGISSHYPRRWLVQEMQIDGYGGSSIWYKGGLNSQVFGNTFMARDSTNTNGKAAIRTTALTADPNTAATSIQTASNYVQGGKDYGYLFENTTIGSSSMGDVAEYCAVGFRFDRSRMTVISPYTEANTVAIEQHDSPLAFIGEVRDKPIVTWSGVAFFDRRATHLAGNYLDPGKGLVYGGATGERNFDTAPSLRWDTLNPNGRLTAPVGSQVFRTDGTDGRILYLKASGLGNTGWVPVGATDASTEQLSTAAHEVNISKRAGLQVFNRTTKRPVWATGPLPTDVWVFADGTTAHTPS